MRSEKKRRATHSRHGRRADSVRDARPAKPASAAAARVAARCASLKCAGTPTTQRATRARARPARFLGARLRARRGRPATTPRPGGGARAARPPRNRPASSSRARRGRRAHGRARAARAAHAFERERCEQPRDGRAAEPPSITPLARARVRRAVVGRAGRVPRDAARRRAEGDRRHRADIRPAPLPITFTLLPVCHTAIAELDAPRSIPTYTSRASIASSSAAHTSSSAGDGRLFIGEQSATAREVQEYWPSGSLPPSQP